MGETGYLPNRQVFYLRHYTKLNVPMKSLSRFLPLALVAFLLTISLTSCELIGGIFKAGAYTGIIGVIVVVALLIWLVSKFLGGRR